MELTHAGPEGVGREAELRRPTGVVCSDFVEPSRWRGREAGRLVDNAASRVDDRLMQLGSDLNSNFDGRIGLSSGKSKAPSV